MRCHKGEFVALYAQAANHTNSDVRKIGFMTELFPSVHIGNVHFNKRYCRSQQGITKCHAAVREGRGVYENEINIVIGSLMNGFDQLGFRIRLFAAQVMPKLLGFGAEHVLNVRKCLRAVNFWLAFAKTIEIGAIDQLDEAHDG